MPHVQTNSLIVSNKKKDDSEVIKLQRCYDCNKIGHNDKRCRYKQQAMKKREIKVDQTSCLHVMRLTTRDYVVSIVAAQGLCNRHLAKITTNDERVTYQPHHNPHQRPDRTPRARQSDVYTSLLRTLNILKDPP